MVQRQNCSYGQPQLLSPANANCNYVLQTSQNNILAPFNFDTPNNLNNKNAPRQPGAAHQPKLR